MSLTIACRGGKGHAPLIHTDDEWQSLLRQLRAKRTVNTVNVIFDLDEMAGWGRKRVRGFILLFASTRSLSMAGNIALVHG